VRLGWTRVDAADGYEVLRYSAAKKRYVRVKTLAGRSRTSWTDRGAGKNRGRSYRVRAFAGEDAGRARGPSTYRVSAIARSGRHRRADARRILDVRKLRSNADGTTTVTRLGALTVGINETVRIAARAAPSRRDARAGRRALSKKVRLMVVPDGRAKKDARGRLVGVAPGRATAYLMAHDGYKRALNVKVVDYSRPARWSNLGEVEPYMAGFLNEYREDMAWIASYLSRHRSRNSGQVYAPNWGDVLSNLDGVDMGDAEDRIRALVLDSPYTVSIYVYTDGSVRFSVGTPDRNDYVSYEALFDTKDTKLYDVTHLAPHWSYWIYVGPGD
jgi:hypothetical protein